MSSEETAVAPPPRRKISLRLGGLLTTIMGVLSLQNGIQAMAAEDEFLYGSYLAPVALCGTVIIIIGIIAVAGGITALLGRHVSLALAGTLLGMLGGGWVNFFLGITAFILYFFADEDL